MDWDRIEGNWKQFTGKVKEHWGKLTDEELTQINGSREELEGRVQARQEVDEWLRLQGLPQQASRDIAISTFSGHKS
jgi:uncharacterized protein YjbJ (UPF0337 family)